MIYRAITILRSRGLAGLLRAAKRRFFELMAGKSKAFTLHRDMFLGKSGIEIGGPSATFSKRGIFPIYPVVENIDNANFSTDTIWEGTITSGRTFRFDAAKPLGKQYICEATSMDAIPSASYDFVLSSHTLEHCANPLSALSEWRRVLRNNGLLALLLPDKRFTFDHRRPITTLEHLIADFDSGVKEDDMTHLPEILALHDLALDPEAGDSESFKSRSLKNPENRCLHHHVFDVSIATSLVTYTGFKVVNAETIKPYHILVLAKKHVSASLHT